MLEQVKSRALRGVTLVELLVGLAVLAILLTVAVPSFVTLMERRRLVGAADNMLASLKLAQSEAARTNLNVTVSFVAGVAPDWQMVVASDPPRQATGAEYAGTTLALLTTSDVLTMEPKRESVKTGAPPTTLTAPLVFMSFSVPSGGSISLLVGPGSHMGLCSSTVGSYPPCP